MTSGTSEKAIRAAKKRAKADINTNKVVIETLMRTVDGRRWIWLKLSSAMIFVEEESLDPMRMAYLKGVRNEGLRLLNDVTRYAPDNYITMTKENTKVALQPEGEEDNEDEE